MLINWAKGADTQPACVAVNAFPLTNEKKKKRKKILHFLSRASRGLVFAEQVILKPFTVFPYKL